MEVEPGENSGKIPVKSIPTPFFVTLFSFESIMRMSPVVRADEIVSAFPPDTRVAEVSEVVEPKTKYIVGRVLAVPAWRNWSCHAAVSPVRVSDPFVSPSKNGSTASNVTFGLIKVIL